MSTMASHEDANLILKLYELRREERMRTARTWFVQSFKVETVEQFHKLCPQDSAEAASVRQMVTYWEMAASFLNAGVLNKELFYRSGMEMLFTYERIRTVLPEMRTAFGNPFLYCELEKASLELIEWLNTQSPDIYSGFSKRVRGA
jgi:hypothetical protein